MFMQFIEELKNMPLGELVSHIIIIAGLVSALIEKSKKLPFNPWSAVFRWIGSKANEPVTIRLNDLEKKNTEMKEAVDAMREEYKESIVSIKEDYNSRIDKLEKNADEKEAKRLRSNIICFSDACRMGSTHTKQHFENIFRDYDDYIKYCETHKFENHFIEGEITYIKNVYADCLKDNKFML